MADDYSIPKAIDFKNMSQRARNGVDWRAGWLQEKKDGCALRIDVRGDKVTLQSAAGTENKSCYHLVKGANRGLHFTVCGEVWAPGMAFQDLSGAFRRQYPQPDLHFMAFDLAFFEPGRDDYIADPYYQRYQDMASLGFVVPQNLACLDYVYAEEVARGFVAEGGRDGAIWRNPHAIFELGRSKADIIKIKPLVAHDLKIIGIDFNVGAKTGKNTGALLCKWKGNAIQKVATGLTQKQVDSMHADPDWWVGQILEAEGMGYTKDGLMREPRFKGLRSDKLEADF